MTVGAPQPEPLAALNRLLRAELTAVNQQSVHLLALCHWGGGELEARIREVDRSDFPATLAIIDHMVEAGLPITIKSEGFAPGAIERDILLAEQRAEAELAAAAAALAGHSGPAGRLAAAVAEPRPAYRDWIAARLEHSAEQAPAPAEPPSTDDLGHLFACLTVMGEQALVHAFVHWHYGDRVDADAAWGVSGAAMVQAGGIIAWRAGAGAVPVPGKMPALDIRTDPTAAIAADRHLAERCLEAAVSASETCRSPAARELARRIADAAHVWTSRAAGTPLRAEAGATRAFASFERTRQKFLRPAA